MNPVSGLLWGDDNIAVDGNYVYRRSKKGTITRRAISTVIESVDTRVVGHFPTNDDEFEQHRQAIMAQISNSAGETAELVTGPISPLQSSPSADGAGNFSGVANV